MSDRQFRMAAQMKIEEIIAEHTAFLEGAATATLEELRLRQGIVGGLRAAIGILDEIYRQMHG